MHDRVPAIKSTTAVPERLKLLVDSHFLFLLVVMDSMGLCDTDLRERATQSPTLRDTHALLKLFLSTLNKMAQSSTTASNQPAMLPKNVEEHDLTESLTHCDLDLRGRRVNEEQVTQDYLEVWIGLFLVLSNVMFKCC